MNLDTYCPIPFSEMYVRNDGNVLLCCDTGINYVGDVNKSSLSEIFHSSFVNDVRKTFTNGQKHEVCDVCWKREEDTGNSYRTYWISEGGIEVLTHNKIKDYREFAQKASTRIRRIKIDFSNACNMKCPMCSIDKSTGWLKDHTKVFKPVRQEKLKTITDQLPLSFIDDNWEHFINSNMIDLSGGEPFYMPQVKYLLDKLVEERYNGVLKVITNASLIESFVDQLAKLNTSLVISCDGYGDLYPIARPSVGKTISWQDLESNLKLLRENNIKHTFCYVPQLMNIHNIEDWINWHSSVYGDSTGALGLPLHKPEHMRIEHYPDVDYKHQLADRLEKHNWNKFDQNDSRALVKQLRMKADNTQYEKFLTYMAKLDDVRNSNFMAIWAENT
mgnify:CR=1 FL=1|jgi:MoaA/NifB/PqqE/SkfB family radical SAM enzyme